MSCPIMDNWDVNFKQSIHGELKWKKKIDFLLKNG